MTSVQCVLISGEEDGGLQGEREETGFAACGVRPGSAAMTRGDGVLNRLSSAGRSRLRKIGRGPRGPSMSETEERKKTQTPRGLYTNPLYLSSPALACPSQLAPAPRLKPNKLRG